MIVFNLLYFKPNLLMIDSLYYYNNLKFKETKYPNLINIGLS